MDETPEQYAARLLRQEGGEYSAIPGMEAVWDRDRGRWVPIEFAPAPTEEKP